MGLLRAQPCRVPVWSVRSTSRSKPVEAEKAWSLPGHSWLGQLCVSSITCNLHLVLRRKRERTEQRIVKSRMCLFIWLRWNIRVVFIFVWAHQRVLMTFETEESRSSLEMKLYVMPKKASGFSWAFSLSWVTVYTSVMESTAETETAAQLQHQKQLRTG